MNATPQFSAGLSLGITGGQVDVDPATGRLTILATALVGDITLGVNVIHADGTTTGPVRIGFPPGTPLSSGLALSDQSYPLNSGAKTFDVSGGFIGTDLTYALRTAVAGISISAAGIVTTATTALLAATEVTVRASNSAGFVDRSFRISVGAAPGLSGTTIPDQLNLIQGTTVTAVASAPAFTGTVTTWSITGAGVSINATTGVITITRAAVQALQTVTVRASNIHGFAETSFQISVVPAVTLVSAGTITGTLTIGSVLTVSGASFTGEEAPVAWVWTRDGTDISGATGARYLLRAADAGKTVARRMTVSNAGGSATGSTAGVTIGIVESAVVFNPLQTSSSVTLSNANRSAAAAGNFTTSAAKPFLKTSPKFYAEVVVPAGAHAVAHIGVSGYDSPNYTPSPTAANSFSTFAALDRRVIDPVTYGTNRALLLNNRAGGVYRIAVDPAAGLVYFGTSAGWAGSAGTAVAFGSAQGFPMPALEELFITIAPRSASGTLAFTLRSLYSEFTNYASDAELVAAGYISYGELNSYQASPALLSADEVVDRFGVNYDIGDLLDFDASLVPAAHDEIGELGVRTIRTTLGGSAAADTPYDWFTNPTYGLNTRFGTKIVAIAATKGGSPVPTFRAIPNAVNRLKDVGASRIRAIEGGNEVNHNADEGWETRALDAQKQLFDLVNASGSPIANVPVLGFTVWERSKAAEASVRAILSGGNYIAGGGAYGQMADAVGIHYYNPGRKVKNGSVGQSDGDGFDYVRMETALASARLQGGGGSVPIYATEFGPQLGQFQYAPDGFNVSPEVAAKLAVRGYLSLLAAGVEMAFLYTFYDQPNLFKADSAAEFGLLAYSPSTVNQSGQALRNVDGGYSHLKRRPAFYAFKSLLSLFSDSGTPTLSGLAYLLSGDLSDIGHLFFRRSDGKYLLALWQDAQTWNKQAAVANEISPRQVKIGLTRKATIIQRKSLPLTATDTAWTTIAENAQELLLSIPDEVVIYEITL